MSRIVQTIVRWLIAIVLVSIPLSYLLWQWRYAEHKELSGLSFESFNEWVSSADAPQFWPYAIWILIVTTGVVCAISLIVLGLKAVFPTPPKKPTED
jgi:ABC-type phosphate transport system permease subunit